MELNGRRSIPQDKVWSLTREVWSYSLQRNTSSRWSSTTRPQAKRQGQVSRRDWLIWRTTSSFGQVGSKGLIKFYFIKCYYNYKDSHQVDVGPKEEELESSWGWLRQQTSLTFIYGKNLCNQLQHLALVHGVTNPLVGKARDKVFNAFMDIIICGFHSMSMDILICSLCGTNPYRYWKHKTPKDCSQLLMVYINIEHPHLQHLHEVNIDKTQG